MNLDPQPMPKMGEYDRCRSCGRCILGCPHGVKWDSRRFLQVALDNGAQLVTGCRVESVVIEGGQVTGVQAQKGWTRRFYPADLVVLAAGGFATPVILQNSGIDCEPNLFVDPVLCVAAEWPDSLQCREIPMPFVMQREHFILSPYFDYVSYLFNRAWSYRAKDLLGIMIKLADSNSGAMSGGQITKSLTGLDRQRLDEGVAICIEILERFRVPRNRILLGTLNAGHPGGMLPLTRQEATTLHHARLPANLYVADGTLLPNSPGGPPILTIVALAKRVSKMCIQLSHSPIPWYNLQ
jgi:choline dehydrogenase-like flavoprotein